MFRLVVLIFLTLFLTSCAHTVTRSETTAVVATTPTHAVVEKTQVVRVASAVELAYLEEGRRSFDSGYYKRAMRQLLPLAADGNPEAQYAVGYMYYYGYGVTQDTEVGCFWITRAADQNFPPAMLAKDMVTRKTQIDAQALARARA